MQLLRDSESLPLNVDYFCRRSVHQGSLPFRVGVSEEIRDALTAIRNKVWWIWFSGRASS